MKRLRPRLTYANVTASIAVFLVLGGGAYAATRLPKNSVKSVNIAPGQVKRPDIAGSAINTGKVADGGLTAADFAAGQLPQGARGEQGIPGPPGETTHFIRRTASALTVNADVATSRVASCNAGEHATGGGFAYLSGAPLDVSVLNSEPVFDVSGVPTGWVISVFNRDEDNDNMGTISMTASVICASP